MRCPSLKNLVFLKQRSFVLHSSDLGTIEYLQEWQAKKAAPMVNCTNVLSSSVTCRLASLSSTMNGRAFCCFCWGLLFLKALYCRDRRMLSSWSSSFVGFCLPAVLKACTTCNMVPLTVPSASASWRSLVRENLPSLTAIANAPSMMICSCLARESMKRSRHPTDLQYSVHRLHARASPSCVPPVTACSRAIDAAMISARS